DQLETALHVHHLLIEPHLYVPLHHLRRSFGVIGDEIERRARFAGGCVVTARAVFQKLFEEGGGLRVARTGGSRTAHTRGGQRPLHRVRRVVVEFVVLLRCAAPVTDIGFVPQLPTPLLHFGL